MEKNREKKSGISPLLIIFITVVLVFFGIYLHRLRAPIFQDTSNSHTATEIEASQIGTFKTNLPSADSRGRVITLETFIDNKATFTQDYQNSQPPIVETGTWSSDAGENLVIVFTTRNGQVLMQPTSMTFVFNPMNAGVLTLQDPEQSGFGSDGLILQNIAAFSDVNWNWVDTLMSDGAKTVADVKSPFQLLFMKDGSLSVQTDCNNASGSYQLMAESNITLGPLAMTQRFCEGSQESVFMSQLDRIGSYFLQNGKLHLLMKFDSGTMTFVQMKK